MEDKDVLEEEKPSWFKKFIIILLAIFLIILFTFYLLTTPNIRDVLYGFVESSKLINSTIKIDKETNLIFNNESLKTLNNLYDKNIEVEFKVCLKGYKINNTYYIEETIQPKTFLQEYNKVIAESCTQEHLVDLHTHPFKQCLPSQQDLRTFAKFKEKNPDALMAIMCEKDRFNFYK